MSKPAWSDDVDPLIETRERSSVNRQSARVGVGITIGRDHKSAPPMVDDLKNRAKH